MKTTPRSSSRPFLAACLAVLACGVVAGSATGSEAQATAAASLDGILKQVSTYDGGTDSAALWSLRDYVYARKDDPEGRAECEAKLLRFLKTPATAVAKMAASRYLRVIAADTAIPALQAMLADPRSADMAIYVLQPLPGQAAETALVQALKTARGGVKSAVIAALGARRAAGAVPALVPLLKQPEFNVAAATAIGKIGGADAAAALTAALGGASADFRPVVAMSMLTTADGLLDVKNTGGALALYRAVSSDRSLPAPARKAAFLGEISAADGGAGGLVLSMLRGADPDEQQAAVAKIADVIPADGIGPICELLPHLSDPLRVQALAVLAGYPGDRVRPAILDAARTPSPAVRLAALRALGSAGDASVVPFLVERATSAGKGPEQDAARRALGSLKGRAIDDAIRAMLEQQPPEAAAGELLKAVADRRIFLAKPAVASALSASSAVVRSAALKALRTIGTPSDVSAVLDLLLRSDDEAERAEAERTAAALVQKLGNADTRSRVVRIRLSAEKGMPARVRLIGILPLTGDDTALPLLRTALEDGDPAVVDAAVRALTAWPTVTARDDVLTLAREAKTETHRLLAIGGLVRTVGLDMYRRPEAAVADLKQASGLAWRPEERKLVLGALAAFPCKDALDMATGFLQDAAVKAEAQAAIDTITLKLQKGESR